MKEIAINSWEELQNNVVKIITSLNKEENLKIAAATNPIFALEELGYKINPIVLGHIEDKMRFRPKEVLLLSKLRDNIHKIAGKHFNIRSEEELNRILFEDLKIEVYDKNGCLLKKAIKIKQKGDLEDDLKAYTDLHPIIELLLAFREIDSSVSGFSDKRSYQKIRNGRFGEKSNITLTIKLRKGKN